MRTNTLFKRWTFKFFAPDRLQRETYESFKRLLEQDQLCHELMADVQDLYFKDDPAEWSKVIAAYNQLSTAVGSLAEELTFLKTSNANDVLTYYKKFDSYIRCLLEPESKASVAPYIQWLDDSRVRADLIGNKANNLALLCRKQTGLVPPGFVVTTNCWRALLEYNELNGLIDAHLLNLEISDKDSLLEASEYLMSLVMDATIPPEIESDLLRARDNLLVKAGVNRQIKLAVRSSAVHEDGMNSFAGQYSSLLEVDPDSIVESYLHVLASKYSPRALLYRIHAGISDREASMAVLVIEMIEANAAGVIYTADPAGKKKSAVSVYSVAGKGEKLVDGKSRACQHRFDRNTHSLEKISTDNSPIHIEDARKLAEVAVNLEEFFGCPQDIEWAVSGNDQYVLQSRPLRTTQIQEEPVLERAADVLTEVPDPAVAIIELPLIFHGGVSAARGRTAGVAHFFSKGDDHTTIPDGAILIVDNIPASLAFILSKVNGVVARRGSVASHFSTICREFDIPMIVAAEGLKEVLEDGEQITIDAESRKVYRGQDRNCAPKLVDKQERTEAPYYKRLKLILDFISPLSILDPEADSFVPESCRSFHDIIRFAHETGVRAMFAIGESGSRRGVRKKLLTDLPFELYMMDVSGNKTINGPNDDIIQLEQVSSFPFRALWQGLSHPSIHWGEQTYYNWKEYDSAALTDGFAFKNKVESASYAVCGDDYLNLNIRFGYHFTIVDTLCGDNSEQNYCSIRFSGGGGTFEGRYYRLQFIEAILQQLGFKVSRKTDLLDGRLESLAKEELMQSLVTLGRMLGTSKLMDMVLKDEDSVETHLDLFFQCEDTCSL